MVKEDTAPISSLPLSNSRRQMKNVISTPKYERRHQPNQPRGKSMDRSLNKLKASAHSVSSLSSESSGKMSSTAPSPPPNDASVYEKLSWCHQFDPKSKEDVALNRRVGFYKFKSEIGAGNFSKVKLAQHQLTKERVAVKIIDKGKLDVKTQKMVSREINIMDSLSHPNLIRLFEVTETVSGIYLMMEYAPGGELFVRLAECGSYTEYEAKPIFAQIASAVQYMHERHFIHRDLKAENVFFAANYPTTTSYVTSSKTTTKNGFLLGNSNKTSSSANRIVIPQNIQVKVGDFGFATQVNKIDQHLTTFCGSPPYAAPELFQDDHYFGPSVDIWALGILLYLMVTGAMPFKGTTVAELKNAILDGHFEMPDYLSQNCIDLIVGILKRRPDWRLTLQQIRESKWLWSVDWPEADNKFRRLPQRSGPHSSTEELSEVETKTREALVDIGIEEKLLESHIERGPRSHIIGAFRITQNKLLRSSADQTEETIDTQSTQSSHLRGSTPKIWNTTTTTTTTSSWKNSTPSPQSLETKLSSGRIETDDDAKPKKTKKSKLCLIL